MHSALFKPAPALLKLKPGRSRVVVKALGNINPYSVLEVSRNSSVDEIREAYLEKIKVLHPDVNSDDTTESAARLNLAYSKLMESFDTGNPLPGFEDEEDQPDVFDKPDGPPVEMFVNPFACANFDFFLWRDLQEVAKRGDDPEESLSQAGLTFSENAISYLSKGQLEGITGELERMEETMQFEVGAYFVFDCLARANWANGRSAW
ncbi:hypothetical protein BSKO_10973 [Bryopsis sp. KO-2023]|nr:hypothetical protein BSKO_10973 [Bryopsis sp. KO-2023]